MGPIKFTLIKRLPRNKRFNYTPRYYKGKEDTNELQYETKFDAYAENYNKADFSGQWHESRIDSRNRNNSDQNILRFTTISFVLDGIFPPYK